MRIPDGPDNRSRRRAGQRGRLAEERVQPSPPGRAATASGQALPPTTVKLIQGSASGMPGLLVFVAR